MPIEFHCDHGKRLVLAKAYGMLTEQEIFDYQREVWSREEIIGYDVVIDMREVEKSSRLEAAESGTWLLSPRLWILGPLERGWPLSPRTTMRLG